MIPTSFEEANMVLDPPEGVDLDKCGPLNVFRFLAQDGIQRTVSCWKVTDEELTEIQRTGRVWLVVMGSGMPPVVLSGNVPFQMSESSTEGDQNGSNAAS